MAASSGRRCHYEVLGLQRDCSPEEIRSAYKKLALQLHPDKLVQSGLSPSDATAKFQELSHAYEVLSDPKERSWYESHRSQILFSDPSSASGDSSVPDLFAFFSSSAFSGYSSDSRKGFYRVYSGVFDRIYANELDFARRLGLGADAVREAPAMGDLESPYAQATAFYGYWLGFATVMDFCWVDVYDAAAGVNRKSRRVMEEENKKARRKARREYNETVRGLAEFAKKRDKRVIDMAVKRSEEVERRKEEERERRRRAERERLERAMAYEEPEWARAAEEDEAEEGGDEEEESGEVEWAGEGRKEEFYCVVCGKKFKSEKQWKNHEQSKKHREKVAELRQEIEEEEDGEVEELGENLRDGVRIGEEEVGVSDRDGDSRDVDGGANGFEKVVEKDDDDDGEEGEVDGANGFEKVGEKDGNDDEEENVEDDIGVLEAMLGGRKNRKKASLRATNVQVENDGDEMEYNNRKGTRRSRRARKEKSGKNVGGDQRGERDDISKENNGDDGLLMEATSDSVAENESNGKEEADSVPENRQASNQRGDKKGIAKSEANSKSKNSSKGKKAKEKSKNTTNACEKCGEEFESKNKLHKHLTDTGHSTLKYR